jgi:hypothetical protein
MTQLSKAMNMVTENGIVIAEKQQKSLNANNMYKELLIDIWNAAIPIAISWRKRSYACGRDSQSFSNRTRDRVMAGTRSLWSIQTPGAI